MSGQRESRSLSTACLHEVPQKRKAETNSQMILAGQAVAIARVNDKSERYKKTRFSAGCLTALILRSITTSFNLTAPILGGRRPSLAPLISCLPIRNSVYEYRSRTIDSPSGRFERRAAKYFSLEAHPCGQAGPS